MFDVSDIHKGDADYFTRLSKAIESGGREAFMHRCLNMEIDSDSMREPPKWQSVAKEAATMRTADSVTAFWHDCLMSERMVMGVAPEFTVVRDKKDTQDEWTREESGMMVLHFNGRTETTIPKSAVFYAYSHWVSRQRRFEMPVVENAFWRHSIGLLKRAIADHRPKPKKDEPRKRYVKLHDIAGLRMAFEEGVNMPLVWPGEGEL